MPLLNVDFPEDFHSHRTYLEPPFHIVSKFQEFVKSTNRPEDFEGLYWGSLDKNLEFTILTTFSVSSKKRGAGNRVPCPMCRSKSKFLDGSLVHIFSKSCIAVIGHECASSESKNIALRENRIRRERHSQEDFLLNKLHLVPSLIRQVDELLPLAIEMEKTVKLFRSKAGSLQKFLRQSINQGGTLSVAKEIESSESAPKAFGSNINSEHIEVSNVYGHAAVASNPTTVRKLGTARANLVTLPRSTNATQSLDEAIQLVENGKAKEAVVFISDASKTLSQAEEALDSFGVFFSEDNLRSIDAWGQHPLNIATAKVTYKRVDAGLVATFRNGQIGRPGGEFVKLTMHYSLINWLEKRSHYFGQFKR